jgi:hypothetical protein
MIQSLGFIDNDVPQGHIVFPGFGLMACQAGFSGVFGFNDGVAHIVSLDWIPAFPH